MIRPTFPTFATTSGAVLLLALSGCRKPEIRVYTVAREQPAPAMTPAPSRPSLAAAAPRARPKLDYKLPEGWTEAGPSQFSLVNFRITTPNGTAMVNITPLADMAGKDTVIVNMWRQQLGEEPLEESAAAESLKPVDVGGEQGKLFDLSGSRDGKTERIVTAFVHRPDGTWFYKLQGDDTVVAAQKTAFLDFLKTVKVKPGSASDAVTENKSPAAPTASSAPSTSAEPPAPAVQMVAPQGWQTAAPGPMQVAKFSITNETGKAEVSVSVFSSETGGTLANVNRWRRQLGLAETDEAGLQECVTPLGEATINGAPGAELIDFSNENRRLLGAIVPREGKWWFYKMIGDASVVNAEHDTFVQFVKSQP